MIVAIGLIGVFLSGFLLGGLFGYWAAPEEDEGQQAAASAIISALYDDDDETVTGDVPPTWTEDALR